MALVPVVALAIVYLVWAPPSADLAAQVFRTELFETHGFEVWSTRWYGGFHLPSYSLLFPPLAALIGVRLAGALSVVAATALFGALVSRYGARGRLATALFGLGAATNLFTGRLAFALGIALALAALLAVDRGRRAIGAALAVLTAAASPVAALFLAFAGLVAALTGRRRAGALVAGASLAGILALSLGFPNGGVEPFEAQTFVLISLATAILLVALPPEERRLRVAAGLYLALCFALFVLDTPVGGNATRLGALMAAPLLALGAWGRRPPLLVALALLPLLYWQWVAPVRDLNDAVGEPSVERAYYEPLLAELDRRQAAEPARVHIPPSRNRWEATYVGERFPLARGWLRQSESDDFELFQDGKLTPSAYREWLDERAVGFVAVSTGAVPDYLAEDEIELIHAGLPFLDEVWSNGDWELHEVDGPAPLAEPPATLTRMDDDGFALAAPPGEYLVRMTYTPHWRVLAGKGCVSESEGWTEVTVQRGPVAVSADLTPAGVGRALAGGSETCSG